MSWVHSEIVYRPPTESESLLLEVSTGCSYGKCSFCRCSAEDSPLLLAPREELIRQLRELSQSDNRTGRIFFTGGNVFAFRSDYLLEVFDLTRSWLPQVRQFSMYARATDILAKSPEELIELKLNGLSTLYIGVESGSDRLLRQCRKGVGTREMLQAFSVLDAYESPYGVSCIIGLGGKGSAKPAAEATAELLNRIFPESVRIMRLTPLPGTELFRQVQEGSFVLQSEKESLEEEILLLRLVSPRRMNCLFVANHLSNQVPIAGFLPRDKEQMLHSLQAALKDAGMEEGRIAPPASW